jgi:hypothetical protein
MKFHLLAVQTVGKRRDTNWRFLLLTGSRLSLEDSVRIQIEEPVFFGYNFFRRFLFS